MDGSRVGVVYTVLTLGERDDVSSFAGDFVFLDCSVVFPVDVRVFRLLGEVEVRLLPLLLLLCTASD